MLRYLRKNMKSIIIVVAALFAVSVFSGIGFYGARREGRSEGIAKVNGKQIDVFRFERTLEGMFASMPGRKNPQQLALLQVMALNQVIDFTLMLEDAKKKGVRVSREEVDATINQIMSANNFADLNAFKAALSSRGFEFEGFKNMISDDIRIQKMMERIRGGVSVNPEDMREVSASHILIRPKVEVGSGETYEEAKARADKEAKAGAAALLERARKGENFADLAKKYSEDPGSAAEGGALGYFRSGVMVPEFEKAAFSLRPGEISDVVKTDFGYHIIRVDDMRPIKVEEGQDLKQAVLKQKQERAVSEWGRSLREKARIEITNPMFRGHDLRMQGRPGEALAEYRQALSENPGNAYLYLLAGDTYLEMNELLLAINEYKQAAMIGSADPDIALSLAAAYELAMENFSEEKGKYRELALEELRRASSLAAFDRQLHEMLITMFEKLGSAKDVRAQKEKIAEIDKQEEIQKKLKELTEKGNN